MRRMQRTLAAVGVLCLLWTLAGCDIDWTDAFSGDGDNDSSRDNTTEVADTDTPGLDVAVSDDGVTPTEERLQTAIRQQQNATGINGSAFSRIDLTDLASRPPSGDDNGVSVRPTRVMLYNDASRTTPLINADPRAGLDLPPTMLVYQDRNDDVGVAYDNEAYYKSRYDISEADDAVDALADNAQSLAQTAAGNDVSIEGGASDTSSDQGIVSEESDDDFSTTLDRLLDAIGSDDSLALIDQIDQRAAALDVGLMLGDNDNQSTLVLLDAGENVARLLSGGQTVGIDLPERILVSEANDGTVTLYYNAPGYLADRHRIEGRDDAVDALGDTLSDLAATATGN